MHEIGVLIEIVKSVEKVANENEVTQINKLCLQLGEFSSMVPHYLEELYPVATEGTILDGSELEIEILEANGFCRNCKKVFPVTQNHLTCPECNRQEWDLLGGKEFYIKEIECV